MQEDKNNNKKGFLKGMKSELKKVIWPTGEQTVKSTFATIAFVIMVSAVLIVFNLFFGWLSNLWISSLSHNDVIENPIITDDTTNNVIESEVVSGDEVEESVKDNVAESTESGEE